jgi:GAF domain-containing protein
MESKNPTLDSSPDWDNLANASADAGISRITQRIQTKLQQDELVNQVTCELREQLDSDRIALYYFYRQWKGQVTFEALSDQSLSIVGMTGADDCFNQDYAQMYLEGRIKATPDVSQAGLTDCHLEFLESIQVKANLVVPVLTREGLWGLLAAHHCRSPRDWSEADIEILKQGAAKLAAAPSIGGAGG